MNCNFSHLYMISLNKNWLIVDHNEDLWTFIWIITRNMLFIQKCPQFSQKMSASNACMLATFFMSEMNTTTLPDIANILTEIMKKYSDYPVPYLTNYPLHWQFEVNIFSMLLNKLGLQFRNANSELDLQFQSLIYVNISSKMLFHF